MSAKHPQAISRARELLNLVLLRKSIAAWAAALPKPSSTVAAGWPARFAEIPMRRSLRGRFPSQLWVAELDVSDLANIPMVFDAAVKALGRIHAVVSNGRASSLLGAAEELELDAMRHIVDTNLLGSIQLARAAVAHMRPLGGGRIIQISSGAGQSSFPGLSLYRATKWGIEGFFGQPIPGSGSLRHRDDVGRAWSDPYWLR